MAIARLPSMSRMSFSTVVNRCGVSKATMVRVSLARLESRRCRSVLRRGKNPANTYDFPEIPEDAMAAATADGPGMETTVAPILAAAETSSAPGSQTPGVPASETSATS